MAQKKAHEVAGWIARPDPSVTCILVYGPDRGMVTERGAKLAALAGLPLDDPFSVVRYDGAGLDDDPGRLIDEARMVPMFGGKRLLWIRHAGTGKGLADAIGELLSGPPIDATLLIEAGDLKKTAPLRTLVEKSVIAMALPCYPDEERGLDQLIDELLSADGKTTSLEARRALRSSLGGDRLASRGEIDKLILYVGDRPQITLDDVTAATGDTSAISVDQAIDASLTGDLAGLDRNLQRALDAGTHAQVILGGAMRQMHALQLMRRAMDLSNVSASSAIAAARPPVFFSRRKTVETALVRWPSASISRALTRLNDAIFQTRRRPELSAAIIRQALLAIAAESARSAQRR